jgi:hypothetical protein
LSGVLGVAENVLMSQELHSQVLSDIFERRAWTSMSHQCLRVLLLHLLSLNLLEVKEMDDWFFLHGILVLRILSLGTIFRLNGATPRVPGG